MIINKQQQDAVQAAITEVELTTDAELVTVLAARSDDYYFIPTLWAAIITLVTPGLLQLTDMWLSLQDVLWIQLIEFVLLTLVFRLPLLKYALVPKSIKHSRAALKAREQFLNQNLHHTKDETGVMIFISEAEHYVEILADRGINQLVEEGVWQSILDDLLLALKAKQSQAGIIVAIQACGALLSEKAPATHSRNDLPNHLVIL